MNGTTDEATSESTDSNAHVLDIDENDIELLDPYEGESDKRTLVGLGPVSAREAARETAENAPASQQPASQSPGGWGSDDEPLPVSVLGKKRGPWSVAVPLLLVAAGAVVVVLRALGTPSPSVAASSVAPPVVHDNAGLAVRVSNADAHVFLDGQDRGVPPLDLNGLAPGSHSLSIVGPAYAPFEEPVTLVNGRVSVVAPELVFVRGVLNLTAGAGADGANVEVVGAGERRELTSLPVRLEVAPGEYQIRAKKPGFAPFEASTTLSAATPDVAVTVELGKAMTASHAAKPGAEGVAASPVVESSSGDSSSASEPASLNITSSPPANIVLDGRPLGKAPRVVDVASGKHTVVFIHPKFGRQSLTVDAVPGRVTSASADF